MFIDIGTYEYSEKQHELFKSGALVEEWYSKYSDIFDEHDLRIARNQARFGWHFFEWFAAIILYDTCGLLSLIEQYEYKLHTRKQSILRSMLTSELFDIVTNHDVRSSDVQCPDLFVYSRDYSEWFFCEVKGPKDRMREPQAELFDKLSEIAQKPIRIIKFISA